MPDPCFPEWCDENDGTHSKTCPNHLVEEEITKARLVELCDSAAEQAIAAYRLLTEEEHLDAREATECAIAEVNEGTVCYVGIGSCGRGWCKHS